MSEIGDWCPISTNEPKVFASNNHDSELVLTTQIFKLMKEYDDQTTSSAIQYVIGCLDFSDELARFKTWAEHIKELKKRHGCYFMAAYRNSGQGNLNESYTLYNYKNIWSSIFKRFMILWKLGKFRGIDLKGIDWPGKFRVGMFIKFVEPMDYFYFAIIEDGSREDWVGSKDHELYKFLREYLVEIGCTENEIPEELTQNVSTIVRHPRCGGPY